MSKLAVSTQQSVVSKKLNTKYQAPLTTSQKGFISQALMVLLLVAGIGLGTYLVQQRTNLLPKADEGSCIQERCSSIEKIYCAPPGDDTCEIDKVTEYDACVNTCKQVSQTSGDSSAVCNEDQYKYVFYGCSEDGTQRKCWNHFRLDTSICEYSNTPDGWHCDDQPSPNDCPLETAQLSANGKISATACTYTSNAKTACLTTINWQANGSEDQLKRIFIVFNNPANMSYSFGKEYNKGPKGIITIAYDRQSTLRNDVFVKDKESAVFLFYHDTVGRKTILSDSGINFPQDWFVGDTGQPAPAASNKCKSDDECSDNLNYCSDGKTAVHKWKGVCNSNDNNADTAGCVYAFDPKTCPVKCVDGTGTKVSDCAAASDPASASAGQPPPGAPKAQSVSEGNANPAAPAGNPQAAGGASGGCGKNADGVEIPCYQIGSFDEATLLNTKAGAGVAASNYKTYSEVISKISQYIGDLKATVEAKNAAGLAEAQACVSQ